MEREMERLREELNRLLPELNQLREMVEERDRIIEVSTHIALAQCCLIAPPPITRN